MFDMSHEAMAQDLASLRAQLATALAQLTALRQRIHAFADWLDAQGYHTVAQQVRGEVLMGEGKGIDELAAAKSVVEAARNACHESLFVGRGPLVTEIARYDWTVQKGNQE